MKIFSLFIVLVMIHLSAVAQDAQMSVYTSSPLELNPATTGYFQNKQWRAFLNYRNQWSSFLDKGIETMNLSFDMPIPKKKIGFGFVVQQNSATKGSMKTFTFMPTFSYSTKLTQRGGHRLSFGLQAGFKQKSFDIHELTFDNQYVEGVGLDVNADKREFTLESQNNQVGYFDMNFGALWFVDDQWKQVKPWFGVSFNHLLEPNESFFTSNPSIPNSKLPRKYLGYGGAEIFINNKYAVKPMALFAMQGQSVQGSFGIHGSMADYKQKKPTAFGLGVYYRTEDAVVTMLSFEIQGFTILFDYEINTSSLKAASNGIGGLELTIIYKHTSDRIGDVKFVN